MFEARNFDGREKVGSLLKYLTHWRKIVFFLFKGKNSRDDTKSTSQLCHNEGTVSFFVLLLHSCSALPIPFLNAIRNFKETPSEHLKSIFFFSAAGNYSRVKEARWQLEETAWNFSQAKNKKIKIKHIQLREWDCER